MGLFLGAKIKKAPKIIRGFFFGAFFGGLGPKGLGGNLSDFCCLGNEIEIDGFSGGIPDPKEMWRRR